VQTITTATILSFIGLKGRRSDIESGVAGCAENLASVVSRVEIPWSVCCRLMPIGLDLRRSPGSRVQSSSPPLFLCAAARGQVLLTAGVLKGSPRADGASGEATSSVTGPGHGVSASVVSTKNIDDNPGWPVLRSFRLTNRYRTPTRDESQAKSMKHRLSSNWIRKSRDWRKSPLLEARIVKFG
jgi:hypothetical protein